MSLFLALFRIEIRPFSERLYGVKTLGGEPLIHDAFPPLPIINMTDKGIDSRDGCQKDRLAKSYPTQKTKAGRAPNPGRYACKKQAEHIPVGDLKESGSPLRKQSNFIGRQERISE